MVSHSLCNNLDIIDIHKATDGRKIMINMKVLPANRVFSLISVYAPNNDKDRVKFFQDCYHWVDILRTPKSQIVMGGDFKTTFRKIDQAAGIIDKAGVAFVDMMTALSFRIHLYT